MEKIIGFHATDKALADSIIANGFSFSRSEEHWLGNGVYFFADPDLAVWWGNNPTNKFGVKIERPCILRSTIEAENICDMRLLEDYTFVRVMLPVFKRYLTAHGIKFSSNNIDAKFRCAFFDWLYKTTDLDVIVGQFFSPYPSYLKGGHLPDQFHMPFTQVQICVFNADCIHDTTIYKEV